MTMESLVQMELKMFADFAETEATNDKMKAAIDRIKQMDWATKENRKSVLEEALKETREFSASFLTLFKS